MANKKVNVGIIGAGGIATNAHLPGYAKLPDVQLLAVCDVDEARAKKLAEQYNIPHVFTDYKKLCAMDELHAVSVCTPNYLHKDPAILALRNGKHVLCEKPLAMNAREGEAMVKAARESGSKLQVGFNLRFDANAVAIKKLIDAGALGEVYYARAQALRRRGIPNWGVFGQKHLQGGGPLIDIGVHILDLTLHMMGFPKPVSVSGAAVTKFGDKPNVFGSWGQWDYKTFTVEDFASGYVRFENGATLAIESSFCANIEKDGFDFRILGDKGGAQYSPPMVFSEQNMTLLNISPVGMRTVQSHHEEVAAFIKAFQTDTPVPVPGEQALVVTKIIDGIYKSSQLGKEVKI
ncbi:MAG TPA: Gfo/Idh/MocA family oxidoreductase [Planctomycetota bacterium]|nr:Gfo/Idh/MocA family oxidoreductase [Planctomycetota bacterium]